MNDTDKKEVKKMLDDSLKKSFSKRIGDTPTDAFQLTPRGYVNLSGTTVLRPRSSIMAQFYFDTTIGRPIYWTGTKWVDGAGSVS